MESSRIEAPRGHRSCLSSPSWFLQCLRQCLAQGIAAYWRNVWEASHNNDIKTTNLPKFPSLQTGKIIQTHNPHSTREMSFWLLPNIEFHLCSYVTLKKRTALDAQEILSNSSMPWTFVDIYDMLSTGFTRMNKTYPCLCRVYRITLLSFSEKQNNSHFWKPRFWCLLQTKLHKVWAHICSVLHYSPSLAHSRCLKSAVGSLAKVRSVLLALAFRGQT